ncbi:MFS transporter [Fructilactobacillus sanfranciscensis]|uniref:MFS transporter n=1 Tax=Fructilactobacillus sanfranciscensis TaxID=1625 RepID=UPI0031FA0C48
MERKSNAWLILFTLALGFIMATLDVSISNVAVTTIQSDLHLTAVAGEWILDSYMLSFASLLFLGGSLSNRYGSKKPLLFGLSLAAVTSVGLALSVFTENYALLAVLYTLGNLGIGISVPAMTTLTMQSTGSEYSNIASTMLNIARQTGSLVGVAVLGIAFYLFSDKLQTSSLSFAIMAVSYFLAVGLVAKIRVEA